MVLARIQFQLNSKLDPSVAINVLFCMQATKLDGGTGVSVGIGMWEVKPWGPGEKPTHHRVPSSFHELHNLFHS